MFERSEIDLHDGLEIRFLEIGVICLDRDPELNELEYKARD